MAKKAASRKARKTSRDISHPKKPSEIRKIEGKLDKVLNVESHILSEEKAVEKKEALINKEERHLEQEEGILEKIEEKTEKSEEKEQEELKKLENIEKEIKAEVGEHPLARVTFKDVIKGLVGAFIGLAVHYTFTYGVEISERLTMTRATFLYILSFFIGLMFIYATGFRKVKDPKILIFMPIRLIVLYVASIIMSMVVLFIFYPEFGHSLEETYKMVAGVLLAAIVGACTADLIGKE